jgi:NAD(P) transhydrogenase subunit alpha
MALTVGVPKETYPGETRVAIVPATISALVTAGLTVKVESGAGLAAGFPDADYVAKGGQIVAGRDELFAQSQIILQVRSLGTNPERGADDLVRIGEKHIVIGMSDPLSRADLAQKLAERGATAFSMELVPRVTRAQSMDVLSSMATAAGYKAVLLAATHLPRFFPMFMTAAGTISPARVFIIGAGVAGLQAISAAKRLGGVVRAYDVRPAVKEQVMSLGAKFVELPLEASAAEDKGGYAKALGEEFYQKQRELMTKTVADSDVVITTAAIPGQKAPILIDEKAVQGMHPGSIIVDLAAERGGNCALTKADEVVIANGVTILGPTNLPATLPYHTSLMYAKNISTFLLNMIKGGELNLDLEDQITRDTLISRDGQVVNARVKELLAAS